MEFIIVTGLSGAGKSRVIDFMEDIGYYCVDNMPVELIPKFAEICIQSQGKMSKVAIVADVRSGENFEDLLSQLEQMSSAGLNYKIIFLDAQNETLIKRYKETRRKHPLSDKIGGSIHDVINYERKVLAPLKNDADYIIDTSLLSVSQLKEQIDKLFIGGQRSITINCISFGFKYGILTDADMVFDVRCMPNPFYIDEMRNQTGLDKAVHDYVFKWPQMKQYFNKIVDMIEFLLPLFIEEGKSSLVIGIGCTGGRHRSVAMTEELNKYLCDHGYSSYSSHRDMHR